MKTIHYCLFLSVLCLLAASCGYPDHLKTLPKETVAVVSFDLAGMASKGDLDKLQETDFYKKMQQNLGEKDAESAKETDEFLKNPLNYGINFLEPVYVFVLQNEKGKKPDIGASIALGDAEKFKTFITKILKGDEKGYTIETATGFSYLKTPDFNLGWNDGTLIVFSAIGNDSLADATVPFSKIFSEKGSDGSVVDVPGFKSYYKKTKDISGWISMDIIGSAMDAAKSITGDLGSDAELASYEKQIQKLKGSSFQFHITFNDDEIYTEYIADLPSDLQKMYSEEVLRSGVSSKMANLVKSTDLGVVSLSFNLKNYMKMMGDNPAYDEKTKETMQQYVAAAQQFAAPFDGDLLITVTDVKTSEKSVTTQVPVQKNTSGELYASTDDEFDWDIEYQDTTYTKTETLPVFLAASTLNDETFGFLGLMMGKDKPKADKLTTTKLGDFELYTTIKDKMLVVGNDKESVQSIMDGTYKGDNDCLMAKGAASHGIYVFANLDLEKYPKTVQDVVNESNNSEVDEAMLKMFKVLDRVEMYNKANYTAVVSLKLKPNGHNSLYTIIESIGSTAYDMGALK